jgi:hypothetical protein
MDSVKTSSDIGLVVPIDVTAVCVGTVDQNDPKGTSTFSGATTSFTEQTSGPNKALLGANVVRPFSFAPLHQLTEGIHLHWALPEALTHGTTQECGEIGFVASCNRWLINRIVIGNSGQLLRKSWVVESDHLSDAPADGEIAITLPTKVINTQDYQHVGRNVAFDAQWKDPENHGVFKEHTGQNLSCVASGDISFAAFYPNCPNVFGFFDDMNDLTVEPGKPINVMYQVTGWYADVTIDPLNGGKTLDEIQATHQWTWDEDPSATPDFTLYSGLIQDLEWDPNKQYIVGQPSQQPIEAIAAIGNTPPEALSAFFRDKIHPGTPFFEELLNAFQYGMINQLAEMAEILHQKSFGGRDGGTIYTITKKQKDNQETPVLNLPLPFAEDLNTLNNYQQQFDYLTDYCAMFRWELFSEWYRLMNATSNDIINKLTQILTEKVQQTWPDLSKQLDGINDKLSAQLVVVQKAVDAFGDGAILKSTAAPRYWVPNEPTVLLSGNDIDKLVNYRQSAPPKGTDLKCRLTNSLLQEIAVNSKTITASDFTDIDLPNPNNLPQKETIQSLLVESGFLNTSIISYITQEPIATLQKSLEAALIGKNQDVYAFTGSLPELLAVEWWSENPWSGMFMEWTLRFVPIHNTEVSEILKPYSNTFFNNNYSVDQNSGGAISYKGSEDLSNLDFNSAQKYTGTAILSDSAAKGFENQLSEYLNSHTDATLQSILDDLDSGNYLSQSVSGFNDGLLMKNQSLQLNVDVSASSPLYPLTNALKTIIGSQNNFAPIPAGTFNPVRAGYMKLSVNLIDRFGQKRDVTIKKTIIAESMATTYKEAVLPDVIYSPLRITQPSRILFRWLAATGAPLQEMNSHPATNPVCGWLVPNHLDGSLFFYNQQGISLGTMYLNGKGSAIMWQSAPGDNSTINKSVAEVFAHQNPTLLDLATALKNGTPSFFHSFWRSINEMQNFVNPVSFAQKVSLQIFIGRPVAVTQAILRMEMETSPALNQAWAGIIPDDDNNDNDFSDIQFPIVLGNLQKQNDGLIGYFKQSDDGYDFGNFYTEASEGTDPGVLKPSATNINLTPSPKKAPADPLKNDSYTVKVMMLVDPRAQIHATTGILPTKSIDIPSDQYVGALSTLESTFLTGPILEGADRLTLPISLEKGFTWSWIEEEKSGDTTIWQVNPDIGTSSGKAVFAYTPQTIKKGWLRLNPNLLEFKLLNSDNQPLVDAGKENVMTLFIENKKGDSITFTPGKSVHEGGADPSEGSILYFHFGKLMGNSDVPNIQFSADGWDFTPLNDTHYQNYWAATPKANVILEKDKQLAVTISNLKAVNTSGQAQIYFDYYKVTGINDGVNKNIISITVSNT